MIGNLIKFVDKVLTLFEDWTLFIAVLVALLSLFVNVILRYGFNYSLAWSEELVREVIIYTTFIGASAAMKRRVMIRIDASVQLLPRLKIPLTYFSNLMVLFFSAVMIYYGWIIAALQVQTFQKTIIMEIPLVFLYALMPLMGVLMAARTIQIFYDDTMKLIRKKA